MHLVGCLCYLYQWCTVRQISFLIFFSILVRNNFCETLTSILPLGVRDQVSDIYKMKFWIILCHLLPLSLLVRDRMFYSRMIQIVPKFNLFYIYFGNKFWFDLFCFKNTDYCCMTLDKSVALCYCKHEIGNAVFTLYSGQEYTNSRSQIAMAAKLYYGSAWHLGIPVWNVFYVRILAIWMLKWLLDSDKCCTTKLGLSTTAAAAAASL